MAIARDAVSNATGTTSSISVSWSHTCTGANLVLVAHFYAAASETMTATYNGVSMTQVSFSGSSGGGDGVYTFILVNPATGAHNIVGTYSANVGNLHYGVGASYTGCAQGLQPDATNQTVTSSATSISTTVTTIANNAWIVGCAYGGNAAGFAATGAYNIAFHGTGGSTSALGWNAIATMDTNGAVTPAGATAVGLSMSGSANEMALTGVSLVPAGTIAFDTSGGVTSGNSLSLTVGSGANSILLAGASSSTGSGLTASWNSVGMIQTPTEMIQAGFYLEGFYLLSPASGPHTVATSGSINGAIVGASYAGVSQVAPGTVTQNSSATSITVTATTATPGCWLVVLVTGNNGTPTAGTNAIARTIQSASSNAPSVFDSGAAIPTGGFSMTINGFSAQPIGAVAYILAPVSSLAVNVSESTAVSDTPTLTFGKNISVIDTTAVSDSPTINISQLTVVAAEIPCSLSVSNYAYLTPTLLAAEQSYAVRPYFNAKIVDDTVVPTQVISSSMPPFSNGTSCTAPDGTVFAVGLDGSGNISVFKGSNLHGGTWDTTTILVPVGTSGFFNASNRYCISTSDWVNGSYYVVVGMFGNFVNTTANVSIQYVVSSNGGATYTAASGGAVISGPTMPNNGYAGSITPLKLCLASIKPQWVNGTISFGWFFLAPNSNSFSTANGGAFKGYDIWYTYGTIASFTSPVFTMWSARYVNSSDWTIGQTGTLNPNSAFDSFYLNGINYLVFAGFNNVLEPPNIIASQEIENYGLFVTGLPQFTGSASTDVWLPARPLISSFALGNTNINTFENPSCSVIDGIVTVTSSATIVSSITTSTSGQGSSSPVTRFTAYIRLQSKDGINFSYPQFIVMADGSYFENNNNFNSVSYVTQGQYRYLLGSGLVWEFQQNNVVADVTSSVVQYTIQETAGQPASISLQIANQNNEWVGSAPTNPGASAISGGKKIVLQQGYYNANGVPETVPRGIFFIDDMNQATSSSTNTVTITGRDFYKLLSQTVSRYAFSWVGPWTYTDIFDGTTLGNWTQVLGTWTQSLNTLTCTTHGSSNVITLNSIPYFANSSFLQVTFGGFALSSSNQIEIYPYYLDSNNWVMFTYVPNAFQWQIIVNISGSQTTVSTGTLTLSTTGNYNIAFRQYDFFKWYIVCGNVAEANALEWLNNATIIGDFDFTSDFLSQPSAIPAVALGCNNFAATYQNFQYIQFNNSNNLQELLRALAVKARIFNFDFQNLYTEQFMNPALYSPNATSNTTNRIMRVTGTSGGAYEIQTTEPVTDGEIEFTASFALQPGTTSAFQWGGLVFRTDTNNSSFSNAYRFLVQQHSGATVAWFERYSSGTWYFFAGNTSTTGSLNFDLTKPHQYRVGFVGSYLYAYIDSVMVSAVYDTNTTTNNYLTSGNFGFFANAGVNMYIQKANQPALYKQVQSFSVNPGDDMADDITTLLQSASMNVAWVFSNIIGFFKALYLLATDLSTYTYQNQLTTQGVDNSDKEYISQVTVYGTGVSASARNSTLMVGVATREAVVVDYTITTQQDAQTAANNYIINQNQYQNQYSPSQTMNVGAQLFDVVTIVDTGNNTSGVDSPTRVYAETFTVGGGQNTSNSIQVETGNV